MAAEALFTFRSEHDSAAALADALVAGMAVRGVVCDDPTPLEAGARFVARVGRRKVPVLVGPGPVAGRWFASIGSGLMPGARLIGIKDADARSELTAALNAALVADPATDDVVAPDDDAEA